jgi:hypothetical protein
MWGHPACPDGFDRDGILVRICRGTPRSRTRGIGQGKPSPYKFGRGIAAPATVALIPQGAGSARADLKVGATLAMPKGI